MTRNREASGIPAPPPAFRRGDIWMVDFGNPLGSELGMVHPAAIISIQEMNNAAHKIGRVIVVPSTSTNVRNAKGNTIAVHLEVIASSSNGLHHTTYFMAEQVRTASVIRFKKRLGQLDKQNIKEIENRLCLVMGLFK